MNAIDHRRRLRAQMEATTPDLASFRPMDPNAEVTMPAGFETHSSATADTIDTSGNVVEGSEAVPYEGEPEQDSPGSMSAANDYADVASILPRKPSPLTDENRADYVDALLAALLEMEPSDYQDALLYLHGDDPTVYQEVYDQLADDEDSPGSESLAG